MAVASFPEKDLLRPFRAGAAQRISKRLKRRFNLIQRFALEVILHGRQILAMRSLFIVPSPLLLFNNGAILDLAPALGGELSVVKRLKLG